MATTTSRRSASRPKPFTVDHFRLYARRLVLDSGEQWEPEDWQLNVVGDLFSGIQQVWLLVPQGNGKTTLTAGIALYHADFTPYPWVPVAASSSKQARILFGQAERFVERSGLLSRFQPQPGYPRILSRVNGGEGIQVYAADKNTGEGIIPTLCLVDEPHVQKDLGLYRTWRGKLRKRGGQIMAISTAGEPGTDFEETRDKIRENARERRQLGPCYWRFRSPKLVMHEFKVPKLDQVRDLRIVKQANPLSVVTEDDLAELLEDDTLDWGEDWLRKTCNIPARSSRAAISDVDWDRAEVGVDEFPPGEPSMVGADFAWSLDTTALVPMLVRDRECRVLGPATVLEPPKDGRMLDSQDVKDAFEELNARNPIEAVVMDLSKAEDTAQWLENELGVEVIDRTYRGDGNAPVEDYDNFTEALRESWLHHTGDPKLRRHVMNAIARKVPGDKYRFDRPATSRTRRLQDVRVIDALTAASMVNTIAGVLPAEEPFVEVIA